MTDRTHYELGRGQVRAVYRGTGSPTRPVSRYLFQFSKNEPVVGFDPDSLDSFTAAVRKALGRDKDGGR